MKSNKACAIKASISKHMSDFPLRPPVSPAPPALGRRWRTALAPVLVVGLALVACAPLPQAVTAPTVPVEPVSAAAPREPNPPPPGSLERPHARWVPASFAELPGWQRDRTSELWPALRQGCNSPSEAWAAFCAEVRRLIPGDDASLRDWLTERLRVYRVETLDGDPAGLVTGYFEPLVAASRRPQAQRRFPVYQPPLDLASRKPYWTRQQLDTQPAAQAALRGREIAWVEDPLDALLLQIQGSGRLRLTEPDGREHLVRLSFAGHNDQPYRSVGRWLVEQGELRPGEASWPTIKDWARRNPQRLNELLWQNPRVVFFREEPLLDPNLGPKGAQAVPLTPGRSIAVDPLSVPYGTPVWLDTSEPLSARPLQRLVMAQDTGSAISGAARADYFWGWGEEAEAQAGRMKQSLRMWVLWPRD